MNATEYTRNNSTRLSDFVSDFELILLAVIMTIICVLTVVGNALVMTSFMLDKKLRILNNYFLLSLAVSDIMIASFSMPVFTLYILKGKWILGPVVCDMWLAQDYMCSSASGLNLLMIAFDRYFSVISPLRYRARRSGKHVAAMISCVWILSFLIWPPWIYAWPYIDGRRTVPEDECYVQFLETNSYLTVITAVIAYYIPVSILCVLYFRIWRETEKRKRYLADMESECHQEMLEIKAADDRDKWWSKMPRCCSSKQNIRNKECTRLEAEGIELSSNTSGQEKLTRNLLAKHKCKDQLNAPDSNCEMSPMLHNLSKEKSPKGNDHLRASTKSSNSKHDNKAAKTLTAILLAFIITATPYNVLVIVRNFDGTHTLIPDTLWNFFYYLFYINSTLNPVCYALANPNFRKTYWKILTCKWSKSKRTNKLKISVEKSSEIRNEKEAEVLTSAL